MFFLSPSLSKHHLHPGGSFPVCLREFHPLAVPVQPFPSPKAALSLTRIQIHTAKEGRKTKVLQKETQIRAVNVAGARKERER